MSHKYTKRSKENGTAPAMEQRVPFFDLQYSMNNGYKFMGHIMEPRYADGRPMMYAHSDHCAILDTQWARIHEARLDPQDIKCKVKCELCTKVNTNNDYMRCFRWNPVTRKQEPAPPNYPVPATVKNGWCANAFELMEWRLEDSPIGSMKSQMFDLWLDLTER